MTDQAETVSRRRAISAAAVILVATHTAALAYMPFDATISVTPDWTPTGRAIYLAVAVVPTLFLGLLPAASLRWWPRFFRPLALVIGTLFTLVGVLLLWFGAPWLLPGIVWLLAALPSPTSVWRRRSAFLVGGSLAVLYALMWWSP